MYHACMANHGHHGFQHSPRPSLADEYAFELIELTAMTCAAISSRLASEFGILNGSA